MGDHAVGTGGTINGVGALPKERETGLKVVAVESNGAAVLSGEPVGNHQMPGIGGQIRAIGAEP